MTHTTCGWKRLTAITCFWVVAMLTIAIASADSAFAQAYESDLWLTYVANNGSNDLIETVSDDRINWATGTYVTGQSSKMAPAQAVFDNKLELAYVANNNSNDLIVTSSTDGIHWATGT